MPAHIQSMIYSKTKHAENSNRFICRVLRHFALFSATFLFIIMISPVEIISADLHGYIPDADQVQLEAFETNGKVVVEAAIDFPTTGYEVDWRSVIRSNNTFSADIQVIAPEGTISLPVITPLRHEYDLEELEEGEYRFDLSASGNPVDSITFTVPINGKIITYNLRYDAAAGGYIGGHASQSVKKGADGSEVSAVAEAGYHFVTWDDGNTNNPRIDKNVMENIHVTACFEKSFEGGEGTAENPYLLAESSHLARVRDNLKGCFLLTRDIDLDGADHWEPIGTVKDPFSGEFDGNGHTIQNLFTDDINSSYRGLFGYAENAVLKNVTIQDAAIIGRDNVGGLVGHIANATIYKCSVSGYVIGRKNVGGLVGSAEGATEASISNSYVNNSNVTGESAVGGLVGRLRTAVLLKKTYAAADVEGEKDVGGLVGSNYDATCENITSSFWDLEAGTSTSECGIAKTTDEMMKQKTFVNWDFDAIWAIQEKVSYPYLQGQSKPIVDPIDDDLHENGGGADSSSGCFVQTLKNGG